MEQTPSPSWYQGRGGEQKKVVQQKPTLIVRIAFVAKIVVFSSDARPSLSLSPNNLGGTRESRSMRVFE